MPNVVEKPQSGSLIYRLPQQFHAIETNVDTLKNLMWKQIVGFCDVDNFDLVAYKAQIFVISTS